MITDPRDVVDKAVAWDKLDQSYKRGMSGSQKNLEYWGDKFCHLDTALDALLARIAADFDRSEILRLRALDADRERQESYYQGYRTGLTTIRDALMEIKEANKNISPPHLK